MNLGTLGYPDLVAEIADLLLSYEGARYVLCLGQYGEHAYLSLRTEASDARAGSVMRQIVGHDGAAGGHGTMAGARLFAPVVSEAGLGATFEDMVRRLLEALDRRSPTRASRSCRCRRVGTPRPGPAARRLS